jgi:2-phospho-L-lactate guanylyltransferase
MEALNASRLWAVVPVKNYADAKQRLASALSGEQRRCLYRAMLEDVLGALADSPGLAGIALVTQEPEAVGLASRYGARVITEDATRGHTAASTLGARTLAADGAAGILQVPADLPLLTPGDVAAVLEHHGSAPAVTIVPSRDKRGSNAVACSPPEAMPFRFGDDSFFPHLERARSLGIEPRVVESDGIALDVDTPEDLRAFLASPSTTQAYAYLVASGIADRMASLRDPQPAPP